MNRRSPQTVVFTDTDVGGVIHVANIKGGVGKSTVATNLAAAMAKKGPTLLIDIDVQGSASVALGVDPGECRTSSWDLFSRRFGTGETHTGPPNFVPQKAAHWLHTADKTFRRWLPGGGEITSVVRHIDSCLDLVPANSDLFKTVNGFHIANFLHNLRICRAYYKYIIIDTPSVWNQLTKALYTRSDLNLIPVTLSALSTKSLRDYLQNVRRLVERFASVKIRIVKNEVFGSQNSKIKGKTRTMNENRRFLEQLCEQVTIRSATGIAVLPQSMLFDLEIPESAIVRDAQDEGKAVAHFHQYSAVTKAFDELARRVQYVLNCYREQTGTGGLPFDLQDGLSLAGKIAAVLLLMMLFGSSRPVTEMSVPRPIAPQQLASAADEVIYYTFTSGESFYKLAKYAICHFRAIVPSGRIINEYVREVIDIHNKTRMPDETVIADADRVPEGTTIAFYPPLNIDNPALKQRVPVYRFFCSLARDPHAYITGDWCERGTGGGQPHYGIDIAATLRSEIITPVEGTVVLRESRSAGRTLGVVTDDMALFFAHMDRRYFKTGQTVKRGDVIGTVGMTGVTSGPHIHLGYGVRSARSDGIAFGKYHYKLTDPKLFFYKFTYLQEHPR